MTLLNIFADLFKTIIGIEKNYGLDFTEAFKGTGFVICIISLLMAVLFYLVLGRWKPIWNLPKHWYITLFINSLLCILVTFLQSNSTNVPDIVLGQIIGYMIKFSCVSFVLGDILFFIFSIAFKKLSRYCKATPF